MPGLRLECLRSVYKSVGHNLKEYMQRGAHTTEKHFLTISVNL